MRIPPTYFALSHAELLAARHEFAMFTLAADVRETGIVTPVHDFVPMRGWSFRRREQFIPLFMPAMSRAIRRYDPDVIHQHFATWSVPATSASRRGRLPLITTLHGADVVMALARSRTAMQRWHHRNIAGAQRQSSRFLAVSEYLAGQAVRAGFDAARIDVHYQGIDTDYYTPAEVTAAKDARPLIVFVGALEARKGVRDLLIASESLGTSREHDLVIIGDGSLRAELTRSAAPNVTVEGSIDRAGVREYLRHATVLVLPTQETNGWREAAGLVLLEAQACGTPVITYRSGGAPEMLQEGSTGLVVPEKDRGALSSALRSIFDLDAGSLSAMRVAARRFVVEQRSLARSADELEQHYAAVSSR
ncbi:MAG TPA: glycosyltransferase [Humibacter sp.]|nr:glycosyltransferase [Humibacter sp.]